MTAVPRKILGTVALTSATPTSTKDVGIRIAQDQLAGMGRHGGGLAGPERNVVATSAKVHPYPPELRSGAFRSPCSLRDSFLSHRSAVTSAGTEVLSDEHSQGTDQDHDNGQPEGKGRAERA